MAETKKKSAAKAPSAQPAISSEQAQAPAQQTNPNTGLALQDLVTVAQIIQLGSQRGAWRAEELTAIGSLYTKLIAFLESVGAITKPENAPQEK